MNTAKTTVFALIAAAFPFAAMAQNSNAPAPNMYDRNVYQQQRIEQGLKDGSLNVQEAAQLERGQSRIDRMESRAAADGRVSDAERARINEAQNRQSAAIDRERNDSQRGNPNSVSSQRMQQDVQRNVNEQRRIANGVESGQLTNREASRLERGESRIAGREARAGRDGHIDRYEQRGIQRAENRESRAIHHERHDGQTRGGQHGQWNHQGHGSANTGWNHHGNTPSTVASQTSVSTPRSGSQSAQTSASTPRASTQVAQASGSRGGSHSGRR